MFSFYKIRPIWNSTYFEGYQDDGYFVKSQLVKSDVYKRNH